MRLNAILLAGAAVLAITAAAPSAHADYYTPSHDFAYRSSYDGPGSPHSQVPHGFNSSHDHDTVSTSVVQPFSNGAIVVTETDRHVLRDYIHGSYRADCPEGTTKIGRECSGTKHVTHYVVGQTLPASVIVEPLPDTVVTTLQPVPVGYRYVRSGNDVILVNDSNVVVTTVTYE